MAAIKELAEHLEATFGPIQEIDKAIMESDPNKAYDNLARLQTTLIGGLNFRHDSVVEKANRQLFMETLRKCVDAIKANETREAASIMSSWSKRWETEDAEALLPEHLMPVAMLAEGVVKSAFDNVVFVSPRFGKAQASSVGKYLNWARETILANTVNVREFFSAQHVHRVLPSRTVTLQDNPAQSQST